MNLHEQNARAQARFWNAYAKRYQREASISIDDFHYGPLLAGEKTLELFTHHSFRQTPGRNAAEPNGPGTRNALELGCGGAQNSLWLTARGWHCTAVDLAAAQLQHAEHLAAARGIPFVRWTPPEKAETGPARDRPSKPALTLVHSPLETLNRDCPGAPFDLVHSVHALQFVRDPFRLLRRIVRFLKPDGLLVLAVQHPLFAGEWLELIDNGFGLFLDNYFNPPTDWRDAPDGTRIGSRSWPISRWFEALRAMGLTIENMLEPPALPRGRLGDTPYPGGKAWQAIHAQLRRIPSTLIIVARHTISAGQSNDNSDSLNSVPESLHPAPIAPPEQGIGQG